MKRFLQTGTSLVFLCCLSLPALAEEGTAHAEKTTLPQLNPEFFPSQIFWLLVTGILMYLMMSKIALPRIARLVEGRDDSVRRDLEQAHRLREEAEDIKLAYTRTLRDADERAHAMVDRVTREIKEKQALQVAASMERINQKIAETEQQLRSDKNSLLTETDSIAQKLGALIIRELDNTDGTARS